MERLVYGFLAVIASFFGAQAAGYEAYARGMSAQTIGNVNVAIESFSAALAAGDLSPVYVPIAHIRRAQAYLRTGKCPEALADLDAAFQNKPPDADQLALRATVHLCLRDRPAAEKDFAAAIALRPSATLYDMYARQFWSSENFAEAADNYAKGLALIDKNTPHSRYLFLFYAISAGRVDPHDSAAMTAMAQTLRGSDWPMTVVKFFRGQASETDVYDDAADSNALRAQQKKCEADFYLGEWHLGRGEADVGRPKIEAAVSGCPHTFIEYEMAGIEQQRLKK